MVYFITAGEDAVKIGYTQAPDAENRIRALQTGNHLCLRLRCLAGGGPASEKALHRYLAAERMRGEWFRLSPRVRAVMQFLDGKDVLTALPEFHWGADLTIEQQRQIEILSTEGWFPSKPGTAWLCRNRYLTKRKRGGKIAYHVTERGEDLLLKLRSM